MFVKVVAWICWSWRKSLHVVFKLLYGFPVLCRTKLKFDHDFEDCRSFCFCYWTELVSKPSFLNIPDLQRMVFLSLFPVWQFATSSKSCFHLQHQNRSKCKCKSKWRNHNVFAKDPPPPVCMDAYPPCFPIMLTGSLWQQLLFSLPLLPPAHLIFLYSFFCRSLSLILFSSLFSVFLCVFPRLAPSINESKLWVG